MRERYADDPIERAAIQSDGECDDSMADLEPEPGSYAAAEPHGSPPIRRTAIEWISTAQIFEPLPPTPWVVPGLQICPGRPSMIAAYGASGKTMALQSLGLSVAACRPVWSAFSVPAPMTVGHLDYDQGRNASIRRYQRLAIGLDITEADIGDRLRFAPYPPIYLSSADAKEVLVRECKTLGLAVIDALRGATPGVDENDSQIRACVDICLWVSERTGTSFVLIHHAGKPKEGSTDERTMPRGSSAIYDGCGAVYAMTAGEKGGPRLVSQIKPSPDSAGDMIAPFYLAIEDVRKGDDPNAGVRVGHMTVEQVKVKPTATPRAGLDADAARMVEAIRREQVRTRPGEGVGGGRDALARLAKMKGVRARDALDRAVELGLLCKLAEGRYITVEPGNEG